MNEYLHLIPVPSPKKIYHDILLPLPGALPQAGLVKTINWGTITRRRQPAMSSIFLVDA